MSTPPGESPPHLTEAEGTAVLRRVFEAKGFSIAERFDFAEGGVHVNLDGWDAAARVGYEYLTEEEHDEAEFTKAVTAELEGRMEKGELFVMLIDEHDIESAAELEIAAECFLAAVAARREP